MPVSYGNEVVHYEFIEYNGYYIVIQYQHLWMYYTYGICISVVKLFVINFYSKKITNNIYL